MGLMRTGLLAIVLAAIAPIVQAQPRTVDVDAYVRRGGYQHAEISPDGLYYAATVELDDRGGLVILRRSDNKVVAGASGWKGSLVDSFWWAKNDLVVLSTAERLGSRDQPYHTGTLFALGVDGSRAKMLVGPKTEPGLVDRVGDLGPWEMATMIDTLPDDPDNVLIAAWEDGPTPTTRIDRLDVRSGRRSIVAHAPVRRAAFTTDTHGHVRFANGAMDDNYGRLYYRDGDTSDWKLVNDQAVSRHLESALGFAADDVTAYLRVEQPDGPDAVVAWNTRTGERRTVQRHETVDPYDVVFDRDGRTVIGMRYMADTMETRLFDSAGDTARLYRALGKAFAGSAVDVTSYTTGGEALVQVWDDRTPGDAYLFDTKSMTANGLYVNRKWIDPATLAAARAVSLKTRDGITLHGYLTPPRGATGDGPWPTVVMPHGGPFGVFDERAFDEDTQVLSEAGYAVLRINFRGSANYGAAFENAGAREWGGLMQDDLTDATHWLIDRGYADRSKICIYGGSYGGYAALMGVAREPDLYRCAVGYVGVYDLEARRSSDSRDARWIRNWMTDWMGEKGTLEARSPTNLAARIKVPVLLVAGGEDHTAPIEHSKKMERALRAAGGNVETLYVASEGHGFYTEAHRREFYVRLLDFLSRHLGGATAATEVATR